MWMEIKWKPSTETRPFSFLLQTLTYNINSITQSHIRYLDRYLIRIRWGILRDSLSTIHGKSWTRPKGGWQRKGGSCRFILKSKAVTERTFSSFFLYEVFVSKRKRNRWYDERKLISFSSIFFWIYSLILKRKRKMKWKWREEGHSSLCSVSEMGKFWHTNKGKGNREGITHGVREERENRGPLFSISWTRKGKIFF